MSKIHTAAANSHFDAALLDEHGPLVAVVIPHSMGLYSLVEIADRSIEASAAFQSWLDDNERYQDPVALTAIMAASIDELEASRLLPPAAILALARRLLAVGSR